VEFTSSDRLVAAELLKNRQVDPFTLHERFALSPAQLFNTVQKFKHAGIISERDGLILREENAFAFLFANRQSLFRRNNVWREVPQEMLREQLKVGTGYTPNWRKLGDDMREKQNQFRRSIRARGRKG
jgi:hypothetical protein